MKTLQNNFTTPEQSKRLLELGVPADSADCLLQNESMEASIYTYYTQHIRQPHIDLDSLFDGEKYLPCWSVGRLIEIVSLCPHCHSVTISKGYNAIESLINQLVMLRELGMDFSKLEE